MKPAQIILLLLVGLMATVGLTGCRNKPKALTPIPGSTTDIAGNGNLRNIDQSGAAGNNGDVISVNSDGTLDTTGLDSFEDMLMDREAFQANTVYFDFDKSEIHPDDRGKVEAVASHLTQNATDKVLIEGHCDERGTEEYNRALGERRALSVRELLAELGVAAERVRTMSYGADRPAADGQDEYSYSKNRRGEFILLKPKPE